MTQHRVAVITGASSGLGKETAKALTNQGWRIIAIGRNPQRCAAAETELREAASMSGAGQLLSFIQADLSLLSEAKRVAGEIASMTDRVDVLVNNAGGMASEKVITSEGLEQNFAANHLGPFVLTNHLLPLLRVAASDSPKGSVRIINTSSDASEMIPTLNLDDMQNLENYRSGLAYCSGKLANVLHARALAGMLEADGIVAHSMHPGAVDTNFFSHVPAETKEHVAGLDKMSVEQGADTLIWLATADEPGHCSGVYWHQRAVRAHNPVVDDEGFVARFWQETEKLVSC